jgi:transaldolase
VDSQRNSTAELTRLAGEPASSLKIKIFADGADLAEMANLLANPLIRGFTTNPTLMRRSGVEDYEAFAREVLAMIPVHPISFEVFSDEQPEMERQAHQIASWGENVYVKIPVTNTRGESTAPLLRRLHGAGVKVNVTGLTLPSQAERVAQALTGDTSAYVSLFAGRIADTGIDPVPVMREAMRALEPFPNLELLWASPREILNVVQADQIGCHIITVTHDLLRKLPLLGKDLEQFSVETIQMFHGDAAAAGYSL